MSLTSQGIDRLCLVKEGKLRLRSRRSSGSSGSSWKRPWTAMGRTRVQYERPDRRQPRRQPASDCGRYWKFATLIGGQVAMTTVDFEPLSVTVPLREEPP